MGGKRGPEDKTMHFPCPRENNSPLLQYEGFINQNASVIAV